MADMSTFEGVPIATYGLTGIMIVALTGLTFFDSKGEHLFRRLWEVF